MSLITYAGGEVNVARHRERFWNVFTRGIRKPQPSFDYKIIRPVERSQEETTTVESAPEETPDVEPPDELA